MGPIVVTRLTAVYLGLTIGAGVSAVAASLYHLYLNPVGYDWFVLAGLTLLTGSFTVKVPSIPARLSVSETFVFAAVLLFGAQGSAAATLIVALESLIAALWSKGISRQAHRVLFNVCAASASIWVASQVFVYLSASGHGVDRPTLLFTTIGPLVVMTVIYFLLNSWLVALAVALERRLHPARVWRENFLWLSLNYFGAASIAALLTPYARGNNIWPLIAVIVPLLVISYLTFKSAMGRAEDANQHLQQLTSLYLSTIETLAMAIDAKDQITHGHIRRVQLYAVGLAKTLGVQDDSQIKAIEAAALLHDMGKLAVPEYILNKPGKLTPAEFERMKLHASVGADILSSIDFPYPVVPIVRHHHENWDGTGYPDKLSGANIPVGARILSVVDCFDALTSDRPYRPRLPDSEAIKILVERRGSMYDPLVVDTFLKVHREVAPHRTDSPDRKSALRAIKESVQAPIAVASAPPRLDEISASTGEMLTLYELARSLTGRITLADAGDVIAKHLRRMLPASLCVFYVYESDCDELVARHASGENAETVSGLRIPLGLRLTGWVGANRQTILNSDPVLDLGEVARTLKPRPRSCLSTPLLVERDLIGVLTLYSTGKDAFTEDHRRIIEAVARQVSKTVRHAFEFDQNRETHLRDPLTGLPNVEHLKEFFNSATGREGRIDEPLALLLVDVDNLKGINDAYGRALGDQVLARIVESTRRALRGADILFRYAGDEFIVLLTETDASTSQTVADRIRSAISAVQHSVRGQLVQPTVSIGIAVAPDGGTSLNELIRTARNHLETGRLQGPSAHDRGTSVH